MQRIKHCLCLALLASTIFLSACSDPKNYDVTKLSDAQREEIAKKLTEAEKTKLTGWMMRHLLSGKAMPSTTIAQALKEQEDWVAQQAIAEVKAAEQMKKHTLDEKAQQEKFARIVGLKFLGKSNQDVNEATKIVHLNLVYENKSGKDIQDLQGVLRLSNAANQHIMNVGVSFDKLIPAGKEANENNSGVEINPFSSDEMKLWDANYDQLKWTFEVHSVTFSDGSKMEVAKS